MMTPHAQPRSPDDPLEVVPGRIVRVGEVLAAFEGKLGAGLERTHTGTLEVVLAPLGYLEREGDGLRVTPCVSLSPDRMEALLDLRAPVAGELAITPDEVTAALAAAGVVFGLAPERVEAACRLYRVRSELSRPMVVARGRSPEAGGTAWLELAVETPSLRPSDEPKGDVDYHERGGVQNVVEDQLLATWFPGKPAQPGEGVDGSAIEGPPERVSRPPRFGKNVVQRKGPEGSVQLLAGLTGVLVVEGGLPAVSLVYTVPGDVNFETGNIDAEASVVVQGSVRPGFRVRARHGILVRGDVEGADLVAGGDVEVASGLIGSEGTLVACGGSLRAKYAQNANVEARGDVELLDGALSCQIRASGSITCLKGRGRLRGGAYFAGSDIRCNELGSNLGAHTRLQIGTDVLLEREKRELTLQQNLLKEQQNILKRRLGSQSQFGGRAPDKQRRELEKAVQALRRRATELQALSLRPENFEPVVVAKKRVHFGVELRIFGAKLHIGEATSGSRFCFDPETESIEAQPL